MAKNNKVQSLVWSYFLQVNVLGKKKINHKKTPCEARDVSSAQANPSLCHSHML